MRSALRRWLPFAPFLLLIAVRGSLAHAQSGCVHSPECPTAVLGVVGGGAAALYARLRSR